MTVTILVATAIMGEPKMALEKPHISVCVCTFKRPLLLERLLTELSFQKSDGLFSYSAVVVDNDRQMSARPVVEAIRNSTDLDVRYCLEPEQNIALARNKAVANASGSYIAFLDDDEFPGEDWLLKLYATCNRYGCDGVLGPVNPHFDKECPKWLIKGGLCERTSHPTGTVVRPKDSRTGNVLFKNEVFADQDNRFDPRFGRTGGEDNRFFLKVIGKGCSFVWCNEAIAYETVPPERWKASYYVKRSVRQGGLAGEAVRKEGVPGGSFPRAVVALSLYLALLPFSLLLGRHIFMRCLTKGGYHFAWLSGYCGHVPIRFRDD